MNVLLIASRFLFPNDAHPEAGHFLANLFVRMKPLLGRIVAVTPVAYVPKCLHRLQRFSDLPKIAAHQFWNGIETFRPPYFSVGSRQHMWVQGRAFCFGAMPLCRALHRRYGFDVVVGFGLGQSGQVAAVAARELGARSISFGIGDDVHTLPFLSAENASYLHHVVRYNDLVLTVSDALRQMLLRRYPDATNIHPCYNGIDVAPFAEEYDRTALRNNLEFLSDRTYMVMCGSMDKTKGTDEFYHAFRSLATKWKNLSAVWVGGGQEEASLRQRIAADGLSDRFRITGWVRRQESLQYIRAADLMVFPSYGEGLPNAVMEALAAGVPTLATTVGGIPELIANGISGLLVPPRDAPALTRALEWMLEHPAETRQFARPARQMMFDHFDLVKNTQVAFDILQHVVSGRDSKTLHRACANVQPGELPIERIERNWKCAGFRASSQPTDRPLT